MPRASFLAAVFLFVGVCPPALRAAEPVSFSRDVLPILSDNCFHCHGPDPKHREADLRLDEREAAIDHGAIVPGKSAESELLRRLTSTDPDERMPPESSNRHVSPEQIAVIRRWLDEGAAWGKHWSFEPPTKPKLPEVRLTGWPRTPIDAFILTRLEREGLPPSQEAKKETLLRRVYLDLTGLPPTPEDVDAFLLDNSADAYERVVDKLLASPRYGERWAWDWLDAARYADSNGYQGDPDRTMWPWRDWVVNAINAGMPYDQFTVEQLAGDMLPSATIEQKLATGFNRNHMFNGEGGRIPEETRVENVMDRVETTSTVWLGLTVGCARCHDHKFDPITQKMYYELYAFFNNTSEEGKASGGGRTGGIEPVIDFATEEQRKAQNLLDKAANEAADAVEVVELKLFPHEGKTAANSPKAAGLSGNLLAALGQKPRSRGSDALREMVLYFKEKEPEYAKLLAKHKAAVDERDRAAARLPRVMVMDVRPEPRETFMLDKGAYDKPGEKVTAAIPVSFSPAPKDAKNDRLGLARWLVDERNPLMARVTVNRYWQAFFGMGLVKTAEDFGVQGESPSHPELLDWLAVDFVEHDWDVKRLHRQIVTSAAYRQSSKVTPQLVERDPENRLLARGPRFRLPSWMIRDQALAVSGLLVEKLGGPSVKPYQPEGIWEEATFGKKAYVQDHGEALYRRSLYIFWRRIVGPTTFFDVSARQVCAVKTLRTNTPLHALTTLNDITYVEAARALAERAMKQGGAAPETRLAWAFRRATLRKPSREEAAILPAMFKQLQVKYLADPSAATKLLAVGESKRDESLDAVEHAAYTAVCLAILNLDETLTKQ